MFSSGARGLPLFSIRARTHTLRSKLIRDTPSRTSVSTFSDEIARQSDPSTRDVPSFASSRDFVRVSSQLDLKEGCSFVSLEWISVFGLETGLADRSTRTSTRRTEFVLLEHPVVVPFQTLISVEILNDGW